MHKLPTPVLVDVLAKVAIIVARDLGDISAGEILE